MTDAITAAILGVVEGITEFLPVSSTGHLLITERILFGGQKPGWVDDLFNVVIQTVAVLAVIPLFHKRFHQFIYNWRDTAVRDYFLKLSSRSPSPAPRARPRRRRALRELLSAASLPISATH
jgi:undecaprenyl-diphosphatase